MPDNSELTAEVLYTAGCWLKDRDPKAADRFYKALVNRCRKTPLGRAADEKRWFPKPAAGNTAGDEPAGPDPGSRASAKQEPAMLGEHRPQ